MPEAGYVVKDSAFKGWAQNPDNIFFGNSNKQRIQNDLDYSRDNKTYDKMRGHALEDWNRNNAYNHPSQQMQRFTEAGLNPHLVYGSGGATVSSQQPRGTNQNSTSRPAPKIDYQAGMSILKDGLRLPNELQLLQAQTSLTNAQSSATAMEAMNKLLLNPHEVERIKTENQFNKDIRPKMLKAADLDIEKKGADISKTQADTWFTIHQDRRASQMSDAQILNLGIEYKKHQQEIAKSKEEVNKIRRDIVYLTQLTMNANLEPQMRSYEMQLKQEGMTKEDPNYIQALINLILLAK